MELIEKLKALGVDTDEALGRFMGNAGLYVRMLGKFKKNAEENASLEYFESGDYETAVAKTHTLKGVTGNLSLTPLYEAYTEIVASLRAGENDKAKALLIDILPLQEKIIACIDGNA